MSAEHVRCFIAVNLSEEIRARMGEMLDELRRFRAGVKWVEPETAHFTLRFLADRSADWLGGLYPKLDEIARQFSPFQLEAKATGAFPSLKRPRVFWVGLSGETQTLARLKENVDVALSEVGVPVEDRGFKPHITLGRVKDLKGVEKISAYLSERQDAAFGEMMVSAFHVMRSQLTPRGPIYTVLREIELRHSPNGALQNENCKVQSAK